MPVVGGIDTAELHLFIRKAVQDQIAAIEAKVEGFSHTVSAFETKLHGLGKLVETKAGAESLVKLQESVHDCIKQEEQDVESLQTSLQILQESLKSLHAQEEKDFESVQTFSQTNFDTLSGELGRLKEQVTKANDVLARVSLKSTSIKDESDMRAALASKADIGTTEESLISESDRKAIAEEIPRTGDLIYDMPKFLQARRKIVPELMTFESSATSHHREDVTDESSSRAHTRQVDNADRRETEDSLRKFGDCIEKGTFLGPVLDDAHHTKLPIPMPLNLLHDITPTNQGRKIKSPAYVKFTAEECNLSSQAAMRFSPRPRSAPSSAREISPRTLTPPSSPSRQMASPRKTDLASAIAYPSQAASRMPKSGSQSSQVTRPSSVTSTKSYAGSNGTTYAGSITAGSGFTPTKFPCAIPSYEPHQLRRSNSAPSVSSRGSRGSASLPLTSQLSPQFLRHGNPSPLSPFSQHSSGSYPAATPFSPQHSSGTYPVAVSFSPQHSSGTYPVAASWPGPLAPARDKIRQHVFVK